jgi:mannosyltransferase
VNAVIAVAPHAAEQKPSRDKTRLLDPLAIAAFAAAVSLAGAGRPSLWFDEAATISASANRSLGDMMRMLGHIDAVHGLYYLIMRGWFALFPATEFWSRASSVLAVAGAAAGVVVLAKQFSTRAVALCAGTAFAIMPRTTWAGIETRSYAWSALAAVWLTVLLVAAARRNGPTLWIRYGLLMALSVLLNVYLVLLVLVHAAVVPRLAPTRSAVKRCAATSFAVIAAVTPFLVFVHGQIFQIGWISPLSWKTIRDVWVGQYFDYGVLFAIAAGMLIAAAGLTQARRRADLDDGTRRLLAVALAWIVIPTGVILVYSALFNPIYHPRYLYFTVPAMALVLGVCVVTVAGSPALMTVVLLVLSAVAVPTVLYQRSPYAKSGMDYSQVADLITTHAAAGDCLVMDNTVRWKPGPIRPMISARPSAYAKLIDPGRGASAASQGTLWDGHIAIWAVADRISDCTVLWTVSEFDKTRPAHETGANLSPGPSFGDAPAYQVPHRLGFRLVERWQFNFAQVLRSTR